MLWLDLFSQFDITIHYVPGKSNVVGDVLLCHPDLAIVFGLAESNIVTQFMKLRQLLLVTHGNS